MNLLRVGFLPALFLQRLGQLRANGTSEELGVDVPGVHPRSAVQESQERHGGRCSGARASSAWQPWSAVRLPTRSPRWQRLPSPGSEGTLEDLFETLPALSGPYPLREPVPRGMQGTHARGRRGTGTAPTVVDSRLLASSSTHH